MFTNIPGPAAELLYGMKLKPGEKELYKGIGDDFLAMLEANVPVIKAEIKSILRKNGVVGMLGGGGYLKYFYYVLHRGSNLWPQLDAREKRALNGLRSVLSFYGTLDYTGFSLPKESQEAGVSQSLLDLAYWTRTEFRAKLEREYQKILQHHAHQVPAIWPHISEQDAAKIAWAKFQQQVGLGLRSITFREVVESALWSLLGEQIQG